MPLAKWSAARKLFCSTLSEESIAVPGVRTRVTSRRTIFLVSLGSSIWSQMAIAVALAQEPGEVALSGVIGNAAHRDGSLSVARGELDLQFARGDSGVFVEELVEVAHAEEEQGIRMQALGGGKLAHDRGQLGVGRFGR